MKKLVVLSIILATAVAGFSQGRLTFGNGTANVNAPDSENATTGGGAFVLASGSAFKAQLWAGAPGALESSFVAIGAPVNYQAGGGAGYFVTVTRAMTNGTPANDGSGTVTFATTAGSTVQAQVRAWRLSDGATYAAALAANGFTGKSTPINVVLTESPTPAPELIGLQSFNITGGAVVPEPSSIALGLLGLGAIALFRRRK